MRVLLPFFLLTALACAAGSKETVEDSNPSTGGEREGDDAGECSDDADNDVDGAFDCNDPDCAGAAACAETDTDTDADTDADTDTDTDTVVPYAGSATLYFTTKGEGNTCSGEFTATVSLPSGAVRGDVSCVLSGSVTELTGELTGWTDGAAFEGTLTMDAITFETETDLVGDVTASSFHAEGTSESFGVTIEVILEGAP